MTFRTREPHLFRPAFFGIVAGLIAGGAALLAYASNTTTTPDMNLVLPIPGQEVGPAWASELITALNLVDSHDHSTGKGVPVTQAGLNLTGNLPLNNHDLTLVNGLELATNNGSTVNSDVYSDGTNLYYKDGAGNIIQITSGGTLDVASGNITGMSGGAAVSYVVGSKVFVFIQSANKAAGISSGPLYLVDASVNNGNAVTLMAPGSLASPYTLTEPVALPLVDSLLHISGAGVQTLTPAPVKNTAFSWASFHANTPIAGGISSGVNAPNVSAEVPANFFQAGSKIRITVEGKYTSAAGGVVNTFELFMGQTGTIAGDTDVSSVGNLSATAAAIPFKAVFEWTVTSIGAGATMTGTMCLFNSSATAGINTPALTEGTMSPVTTFNSTLANYVTLALSTSSANDTVTIQSGMVEFL